MKIKKRYLEGRVRFEENHKFRSGEIHDAWIFENKQSDEENWGLDTAYVIDENGRINAEALDKLRLYYRELEEKGHFYF